jgi:hypothetical protein
MLRSVRGMDAEREADLKYTIDSAAQLGKSGGDLAAVERNRTRYDVGCPR